MVLDYQKLLTNIPKAWKNVITNRSLNVSQLTINSGVFSDILSGKKGSSIFYDKIMKSDTNIGMVFPTFLLNGKNVHFIIQQTYK